jgi:predicted nucleic acid-binding protein
LKVGKTLWLSIYSTSLEHTGQRVDQFDLLIGATAMHHELTLVTSNLKHFERMQGLEIENWK